MRFSSLFIAVALAVTSAINAHGVEHRTIQQSEIPYGLQDSENMPLQKHNTRGLRSDLEFVSNLISDDIHLKYPSLQSSNTDVDGWNANEHMIWADPTKSGLDDYDFGKPSNSRDSAKNIKFWYKNPLFADTKEHINNFEMYKKFSFRQDLRDSDKTKIPSTSTHLIVLCHGWNNGGHKETYSDEFETLINNLKTVTKGTKWKVCLYRWGWDSNTGTIVDNDDGDSGIGNGTQAAEIGHVHGLNLGKLIQSQSKLKQVHFIAHSAGTWVARSAARHLNNNLNIDIQVTLLDPYVPGRALDLQSNLGKTDVNEIANWHHINFLENYYAREYVQGNPIFLIPLTLVFGTDGKFDWPAHKSKQWSTGLSWKKKWGYAPFANNHNAPIQFYADTILEPEGKAYSGYGWINSLFYKGSKSESGTSGEVDSAQVKVKWDWVGGANQYYVRSCKLDGSGAQGFWVGKQNSKLMTFTPGSHNWYVRAFKDGIPLGPSTLQGVISAKPPGTPVLLGPTGERKNRKFAFRWKKAARASSYQLVIKRKISKYPELYAVYYARKLGPLEVKDPDNSDQCKFEPPLRFRNGGYKWSVRAYNEFQKSYGSYAEDKRFYIHAFETPEAISPSGTSSQYNPPSVYSKTMKFSAIPEAGRYHFQVRDPRPSWNPRINNFYRYHGYRHADWTRKFTGFNRYVTYQWKVRAYDVTKAWRYANGREFSPWSSTKSFRLNKKTYTPWTPPTSSTPVTGSYNVSISTTPTTVKLWDNSVEDGDIVDVYLNGRLIDQNVYLTNGGTYITVNFIRGQQNTLKLYAVSAGGDGVGGPCTASVYIYNVYSGYSSQKWEITQGYSRSISVYVR